MPSGQDQTYNLSTHLKVKFVSINFKVIFFYLAFLMMEPQLTITFPPSFLDGWVMVGFAWETVYEKLTNP